MLRLIAFFFGGLVLANVVIVTFETARSAISPKQVSASTEQKAPAAGKKPVPAEVKSAQAAESKPAPEAKTEEPRQYDWVYSERFNAHAEVRQPPLPQWLRTQ